MTAIIIITPCTTLGQWVINSTTLNSIEATKNQSIFFFLLLCPMQIKWFYQYFIALAIANA